jgi:hypothetical protein
MYLDSMSEESLALSSFFQYVNFVEEVVLWGGIAT